jgi:hypothetical protein
MVRESTTIELDTAAAISADLGGAFFASSVDAPETPKRPRSSKRALTLTPDAKDWTWVLERPCPECGFDPANFQRDGFARTVRDCAGVWATVLSRDGVAERTNEDRWSDLEYGCHVRDVYRIMDGRLASMLAENDPLFQNWDQDETAINERYAEQDPATVSAELAIAADQFAQHIDAIEPSQWSRPGTRSNGSRFTVETLVRYGLHDVLHHEWDVSRD